MGDKTNSSKANQPFPDNWSYIKTELQWLDRLLLLAVGRHKRDRKETEQASRSQRDRVTRHWWKGIVSLEGSPRYDDIRPAADSEASCVNGRAAKGGASSGSAKVSKYQQQLERRISLTQEQGVLLALPALRDRLNLTLFEKNLVLLGLAPEVNRRYARLYSYLQENEATQLPQLDLALKLLCRNDQEWQAARMRLTSESPLVEAGLVSFVAPSNRPLLMHSIQLSPGLVNYALAKPVQHQDLELLLSGGNGFSTFTLSQEAELNSVLGSDGKSLDAAVPLDRGGAPSPLSEPEGNGLVMPRPSQPTSLTPMNPGYFSPPPTWERYAPEGDVAPAWNKFIGERALKQELQHLADRLQTIALDEQPAVASALGHAQLAKGTFAIFHGPAGTGKTAASHLIAQTAQTPLITVDLRHYPAAQLAPLVGDLLRQSPTALMLDGAECLLAAPGRNAAVPQDLVHRFFSQRRAQPCLTMFSVHLLPLISSQWQQQCDRCLVFPFPKAKARERLWKQAFPKGTRFDSRLNWTKIAGWRLSGGQIQAIAHDAHLYARLAEQKTVTQANIERAWRQRP